MEGGVGGAAGARRHAAAAGGRTAQEGERRMGRVGRGGAGGEYRTKTVRGAATTTAMTTTAAPAATMTAGAGGGGASATGETVGTETAGLRRACRAASRRRLPVQPRPSRRSRGHACRLPRLRQTIGAFFSYREHSPEGGVRLGGPAPPPSSPRSPGCTPTKQHSLAHPRPLPPHPRPSHPRPRPRPLLPVTATSPGVLLKSSWIY